MSPRLICRITFLMELFRQTSPGCLIFSSCHLKRTISAALFHRQSGVVSLLRETEAFFWTSKTTSLTLFQMHLSLQKLSLYCFLETAYVTLLIQLEQPDFVNPHI
uniref:Uncharacterized protein n=1 Tax=Triticum urartu TaxID=4572 RepID=A0A8R7PUP8_TRIUA